MKHLIIFSALVCLAACQSARTLQHCKVETRWKMVAIDTVISSYYHYIALPENSPYAVGYYIDLRWKILDINRSELGRGLFKLQKLLKDRSLSADSAYMINMQRILINPEELDRTIFFVYCKEGNFTISTILTDKVDLDIGPADDMQESIKYYFDLENSSSNSLILITKFDKNWNFEVKKAIINPEI